MNKILVVIVILIAAVGIFAFVGNKKAAAPTIQTTAQPTAVTTKTQTSNSTTTVVLTDTGFVPKEITVKAGTTVVWINKSRQPATVNSDNHPTHLLYPFLNLGEFADGASLQVVFDKAGKYSYHNHFNASERGFVTVE